MQATISFIKTCSSTIADGVGREKGLKRNLNNLAFTLDEISSKIIIRTNLIKPIDFYLSMRYYI